MHFRFLLADQHGDIELSEKDLRQPFLLSPTESHPFLTLADYFGALQKFITQENGRILHFILNGEQSRKEIDEIVIRSEKHGAFYHIASVSLTGTGGDRKFAVTTALSEPARLSLAEEIRILQQLSDIAADFIPAIYCHDTVQWKTESGAEEFLMMLGWKTKSKHSCMLWRRLRSSKPIICSISRVRSLIRAGKLSRE